MEALVLCNLDYKVFSLELLLHLNHYVLGHKMLS